MAERESGESVVTETACSYRQCLQDGQRLLEQAGIGEAAHDAWLLFSQVFGMSRARYYMDMNRICDPEKKIQYEKWLELRAQRIPLQHITGCAPFMGYDFYVNKHVLTPRADTEVLVEKTFETVKEIAGESGSTDGKTPVRILDMCTGSGCIAVSLACMAGEQGISCEIMAADLSSEALSVAARNNRELCQGQVCLVQSNLFESLPDTAEFDIIVSNPPYIRSEEIDGLMPEVRDHEPRMALDGKEDGLYFYRKLAREGRRFLKPGGRMFLEIGYDQGVSVPEILTGCGYLQCGVFRDLAGLDRVVSAVRP